MEDLITTVQTILSICGGISIIGGAAAILTGAYKKYKKPTNDLEKSYHSNRIRYKRYKAET